MFSIVCKGENDNDSQISSVDQKLRWVNGAYITNILPNSCSILK